MCVQCMLQHTKWPNRVASFSTPAFVAQQKTEQPTFDGRLNKNYSRKCVLPTFFYSQKSEKKKHDRGTYHEYVQSSWQWWHGLQDVWAPERHAHDCCPLHSSHRPQQPMAPAQTGNKKTQKEVSLLPTQFLCLHPIFCHICWDCGHAAIGDKIMVLMIFVVYWHRT